MPPAAVLVPPAAALRLASAALSRFAGATAAAAAATRRRPASGVHLGLTPPVMYMRPRGVIFPATSVRVLGPTSPPDIHAKPLAGNQA